MIDVTGPTDDQIQEFADLFFEETSARQLLVRSGFRVGMQPVWGRGGTPLVFWREVFGALERGAVIDGPKNLLRHARQELPANKMLIEMEAAFARADSSTRKVDPPSTDRPRLRPPIATAAGWHGERKPDAQPAPITQEPPLSDPETLDWEDAWQFPNSLIQVWVDGAELAWAAHAWSSLTEAGLTLYRTEEDRIDCLLRAVALAAFYRDFCSQAFEEGHLGDWDDLVVIDVVGEYPFDEFTLGQLAQRHDIGIDNEYGDAPGVVLALLVRRQYWVVAGALRAAWGDAYLFAALCHAQHGLATYPLTDEQLHDAVNQDVTIDDPRIPTYDWIVNLPSH
ncbi:effector-associated domain EAD1-containing protein [Pseudofrankia sp. DC12]|uniref:effector-associated domain EAD1-containing protein n=1 Tax=Pseudofrankia sp. DC12 TaxID=683315 RepID=UPI0005F8825E|nr:effector-associated domain EAD1-containing protein [Pseudofrankia sp. DC12]